jgi:hypothetical protein
MREETEGQFQRVRNFFSPPEAEALPEPELKPSEPTPESDLERLRREVKPHEAKAPKDQAPLDKPKRPTLF